MKYVLGSSGKSIAQKVISVKALPLGSQNMAISKCELVALPLEILFAFHYNLYAQAYGFGIKK